MVNDGAKVLIIDDFEMVRVTLRDCLRQLGYQNVEEAVDGQQGLEMLESALAANAPYSMIFADLNMPRLTGVELLVACRKNAELRKIPFVMISAEAERQYVVQALQQGAADYIIKPFSTQTLQRKIEKVTNRFKKSAA